MQKNCSLTWKSRAGKRFNFLTGERGLCLLGVALVAVGFLPYVLLGEGSVIGINDQLDGEIFTYLFGAEYLFSGKQEIAQWMGGIGRESLLPPSVLTVLFYRLLPAFSAFIVNQFMVAQAAFLGMNAFLKKMTGQKEISFVIALIFAYLPFYSVYGLTVAGVPMLVFAFWELTQGKKPWQNLMLVLLYGLTSSFVLFGYTVIGCLVLYCAALLLRRSRTEYRWVYLAAGVLLAVYVLCNLELVFQMLGLGGTVVSHKTAYVLQALPFADSFWDLLKNGSGHAPSYHGWMLFLVMAALVLFAPTRKDMTPRQRRFYVWLELFFAAALLIACFYGAFHSAGMVAKRQELGGLFVYFQLDRIYWLYPFLWYTMLALVLCLLRGFLQRGQGILKYAGTLFLLALTCVAAFQVLWHSDFKRNVRQLANPQSSNAVTWEKYYGADVFTQIEAAIGREKADYRVGSVALNPAAAAYNGFYTVDGYSNNYPLAYKQEFRKVIAPELEKDGELRRYFDGWGNRCYLFTAQLGQQYYFEKGTASVLTGLSFDMQALKKLGCEYLFCGLEIENAQELGLHCLGSFESEMPGGYCIRVYRIA